MSVILGCVSSSSNCTRVIIGLTRAFKSSVALFTLAMVRFTSRNNIARIVTCTTRAIAETMLKISSQTCICASTAQRRTESMHQISHAPLQNSQQISYTFIPGYFVTEVRRATELLRQNSEHAAAILPLRAFR